MIPEAVSFSPKANEIGWKGGEGIPRDHFVLKDCSVTLWGPTFSKDFSAEADFALSHQLQRRMCFSVEWAPHPAASLQGCETAWQETGHRLDLDSATAQTLRPPIITAWPSCKVLACPLDLTAPQRTPWKVTCDSSNPCYRQQQCGWLTCSTGDQCWGVGS